MARRAIFVGALLALIVLAPREARVTAAASAGRVVGKVSVTYGGKPKGDASQVVIYLVGFEEQPRDGFLAKMAQHKKAFDPPLLAITAGESVDFPNQDKFFHNVFSLSPARKFDLGQFKDGDHKTKVFPKPGVIDVYCNIHPEMAATILVLPNRKFTYSAADGSFAIDGVPPGTWTAFAYDRFSEKPVKASVTVTAGADATVTFDAIEENRTLAHKNKYGEAYKPGSGGGYK